MFQPGLAPVAYFSEGEAGPQSGSKLRNFMQQGSLLKKKKKEFLLSFRHKPPSHVLRGRQSSGEKKVHKQTYKTRSLQKTVS